MQDLFSIRGKVVVMTGAGGVIGSVLSRDLAKLGAKVAVLSRTLANAQKVAQEILDGGGDAIALPADVLDENSMKDAAKAVMEKYGCVDILINGAGGNNPLSSTAPGRTFFDLDMNAIKSVFDLNFTGIVLTTQIFGKIMADQGYGSIVNIASMASYRPLTRTIAYSAAKAALVNFTEWMSVHFAKEYSTKIRVNAIAPGFLLTKQNDYLLFDTERKLTPRGKSILDNTPMGRFGEPAEMTGAVVYLCSDAASFVTGAVIPLDGGFNAFSGV
ncbi:MAG: SDR family oxidoreductase [Christensenellales bacterium]